MKKKMGAWAALCLLLFACLPVPVQAASEDIHSIAVDVQLEDDGSGWITEVWDVTVQENTEWYLIRDNLDNQEITDLSVTDENGLVFENIGAWDTGASFEEKAGRCGLVETARGYEICWGLGSYGNRVYTVRYRMSNLVKAYSDADALRQFLVVSPSGGAENVALTLRLPGRALTPENSGVWVFGFGAESAFEEGLVVVRSSQVMQGNQNAGVLLRLDKGLLNPVDQRRQSFEEIRDEAFVGSDYTDGDDPGRVWDVLRILIPVIIGSVVMIGFVASRGNAAARHAGEGMKPEYKRPEYSRALPFGNNLKVAYTRLKDLRQLPDEGSVIGVYLLRWMRSRQVELVKFQKNGFFGSKEEDAIKLYDARPGMDTEEKALYDMLVGAAGSDWILQSKEFEKWSQRNYEQVQGWLSRYQNQGHDEMRRMGAAGIVEEKVFFGLSTRRRTVVTPEGERLTAEMFGFKKYLEDFTIINEREAREVQLWDEYLVYAQLFGIAEQVAKQFQALYPDYFVRMATQMGTGMDMFDVLILTRMANNYSRAMSRGYQSGYNAAQAARYSGGGGSSSMGGGGGFSGGFSGGGSGNGSR